MTDEMRFLCSDILRYYGEEHQQEKATFIKTQNNKILRQIERIKGEEYKPDDLHEQLFRQGYIEGLKKAKEKGNVI